MAGRITLYAGRGHQTGVVLLGVMVVIFASMMLVGILVDEYLGVEARAVDQSLASTRARWALSGHVDYVLSRARAYGGDPGYADDAVLVTALNSFDQGIPADVYDYDTVGADVYQFQVGFLAKDQDSPPLDGWVSLEFDLLEVADEVPLLRGISNRQPGVTVVVCIGTLAVRSRTSSAACLDGTADPGDPGVATVMSYESQ